MSTFNGAATELPTSGAADGTAAGQEPLWCTPSGPSRRMDEYGIGREGAVYVFQGCRYDRLADAVAHAALVRGQVAPGEIPVFLSHPAGSHGADVGGLQLTALLSMEFKLGAYRSEARHHDRHHDRLRDAVSAAMGMCQLQQQRPLQQSQQDCASLAQGSPGLSG